MKTELIDTTGIDLEHLDSLWTVGGRLRLLSAQEFRVVPHDQLRVWCGKRGRYGIPTIELIQWLKDRIGERMAIEVGAGNGDLGYHLGIPASDSYVQQHNPSVTSLYTLSGQAPTNPNPLDVVKVDAERAVQIFKPDVVVASWLTRKFVKGVDVDGRAEASVYGPMEEKILKGCAEYIHIGNMGSHSQKTLLSLPHETHYLPWLVSRAQDQSLNVVHIWKNPYYPAGRRN